MCRISYRTYSMEYSHSSVADSLKLIKKFAAFYETRKFIIMFTIARHLSLSIASLFRTRQTHNISLRSTLIASSHLCLYLPRGLLSSGFPTYNLYAFVFFPRRATCPAHPILLGLVTRIIFGEG